MWCIFWGTQLPFLEDGTVNIFKYGGCEMKNLVAKLKCRKGQGTIEYAMATLVVVAVLLAILISTNNPLKDAITQSFEKVAAKVQSVP